MVSPLFPRSKGLVKTVLVFFFGEKKIWLEVLFCSQTELLLQTQLTRETAALSPTLQRDFRRVLELAPRLLEELMKVSPFFLFVVLLLLSVLGFFLIRLLVALLFIYCLHGIGGN